MRTVEKPLDALGIRKGKEVLIRLKNGIEVRGKLQAFDIHLNVVLDDAEFIKDGELDRKFSQIFLRGDMIIFVS
ncbi:MAG: hypothetical protein A7315_00595 [Candidatus Altiarchaeales archaeon WOR_SM1_79]|nr:MAG: hypothetical protein A7315_00595 [Candidatus Altiarchaeales archaeon WOR_SM1_79]